MLGNTPTNELADEQEFEFSIRMFKSLALTEFMSRVNYVEEDTEEDEDEEEEEAEEEKEDEEEDEEEEAYYEEVEEEEVEEEEEEEIAEEQLVLMDGYVYTNTFCVVNMIRCPVVRGPKGGLYSLRGDGAIVVLSWRQRNFITEI
jgi:hypothetical protein